MVLLMNKSILKALAIHSWQCSEFRLAKIGMIWWMLYQDLGILTWDFSALIHQHSMITQPTISSNWDAEMNLKHCYSCFHSWWSSHLYSWTCLWQSSLRDSRTLKQLTNDCSTWKQQIISGRFGQGLIQKQQDLFISKISRSSCSSWNLQLAGIIVTLIIKQSKNYSSGVSTWGLSITSKNINSLMFSKTSPWIWSLPKKLIICCWIKVKIAKLMKISMQSSEKN